MMMMVMINVAVVGENGVRQWQEKDFFFTSAIF
jgi:hypothetical protein